jgi:hypothetical protein
METDQDVPSFLEHYKPQGTKLTFEADSDFEEDDQSPSENHEDGAGQSGTGFGGSGPVEDSSAQEPQAGAWGAPAGQPAGQPAEETSSSWGGADTSTMMASQTQLSW